MEALIAAGATLLWILVALTAAAAVAAIVVGVTLGAQARKVMRANRKAFGRA